MNKKEILNNKKILIVDDEQDILDSLDELLDMCSITKASGFEEARNLLETDYFDLAILDIMGVDGFSLLETATERRIPAAMLTANALSPENTIKSFKGGAAYYIPKEKMSEIDIYLKEVFVAQKKGIEKSANWFHRLGSFFENRFEPGWKNKDKKFWDDFTDHNV